MRNKMLDLSNNRQTDKDTRQEPYMHKGIAIMILLILQSCSSEAIKVNTDSMNMSTLRNELLFSL